MKQTAGILIALAAALLLATGLIVNANIDQSRMLEWYQDEVNSLQSKRRELEKQIGQYEAAEEAAAKATRSLLEEQERLKQQLATADSASQEAAAALEQQKRQNEKQLQELEALAAEYEDLSDACSALENTVRQLKEAAVQTAASHEEQMLADAERIAQLEAELKKASAANLTVSAAASYADNEQSAKEPTDMMIDVPAQPGEGPVILPTPDASADNQPAQPEEGPSGLPTPEVVPQVTSPQVIPVPQVTLCPLGYSRGIVQNGQTFTDLLLQHNVSWQAMRLANPTLPTTRLAPGTRYCIPPAGSRRLCPSGTDSYVMGQFEDLNTLSELFGVAPGVFLSVNTQLAPGDFTAGRVVCVP
ncbi:MAG: hypothetical protein IKU70_02120 [Clostridia bacterium]|nr:hypothetical protein [Clostridia bacterium]